MDLASLQGWVGANGPLIALVAVYLALTVLPRPHASDFPQGSAQAIAWGVVDRLAFLTAKSLPGKFKWIGLLSPLPGAALPETPLADESTQPGARDAREPREDAKTDKPNRAA